MVQETAPEGPANPQRWENQPPPVRGPGGAVTQRKGRAAWRDIRWVFYKASGGPKTYEYGKTPKVIQRESESPSEFYKRLCEACRLYTPIDPEATGSQVVINAAFVSLASPENIRWGSPSHS